jgi:hypothetical protein
VADPSYIDAGPKDTSFWTIAVTNASATECFVGPVMDITFESGQGPLKMTRMPWPGDIVYLGYGQRAVGEIDVGPCHDPRITTMSISPSQGLGSMKLDPGPAGGWGTPCPARPETYFIELYADSNQVGYLATTETGMQAPESARPGERLRFLVTITNTSDRSRGFGLPTQQPTPSPLGWAPCPTYHMELEGVAGTFHTYQLNCSQAQTIQANGSETFEMFIDVPAGTKPGPATLVWSIDGSPQQWQRATAFVPITS